MDALTPAVANPFGYSMPIWQRFRKPSRAGIFAAGDRDVVSGRAGTPAARSVLQLQFRFDPHGQVADARFRAYGCPTSIAVGGWIADWAIGRSVEQLQQLRVPDLLRALEIAEDRAHCAVMGEDALRSLIANCRTIPLPDQDQTT